MLTNWKIQFFTVIFIFCTCFFSLSFDQVVTAANMNNNLLFIKMAFLCFSIAIAIFLHILFQIVLWPIPEYFVDFTGIRSLQSKRNQLELTERQLVNCMFFLFMSFNWLAFIYALKIYKNNQKEL